MTWCIWIRQTHRWLGIVLALTIVVNFVVRAFGESPDLITYSPLPPLFLQLFSGLYMFFRPYGPRRKKEALQP